MPSATDFFPAYITEFMNFVMMMFPTFGSGSTSRFSAEWRRDICFFPRHGRARPGHPRLKLARLELARLELARLELVAPGPPGLALLRSLRTLGAVLRAALLAVLDALSIEDAAENVVAHAGQVLDAAAADHDHGVLLKVMAFTRNVTNDLEAIGQAHLCDLAKRRVRLLRGRSVDPRANPALLRRLLQRRHFLARLLHHTRTCDQLVDRRHVSLHPLYPCENRETAPPVLVGIISPIRSPRANSTRAKRNRANCSLLSGKRFDATEDRSRNRSVYAAVGYRGHASEFNLKRTCSRETKSSWHCLAIFDSV